MPAKGRERRHLQLRLLPALRLEALDWPERRQGKAKLPACLEAQEGIPHLEASIGPFSLARLASALGSQPGGEVRRVDMERWERGEQDRWKTSGLGPGMTLGCGNPNTTATPAQDLGKRTTTLWEEPRHGVGTLPLTHAWRAGVQPGIKDVAKFT